MPNHTHLLPVPATAAGLTAAIGETHRRYSTLINAREHWTGHLWQGRFASFSLEDTHLLNAVRYIERHAVRAGLTDEPWAYPWSSAAMRVGLRDDPLVTRDPVQSWIEDWRAFLAVDLADDDMARFRLHTRTGRPLGSTPFLHQLESLTGRQLLPQKRGRPLGEKGEERA